MGEHLHRLQGTCNRCWQAFKLCSVAITFLMLLLSNQQAMGDSPLKIPPHQTNNAKISIIIDDIGYSHKYGMAAMRLPGELTYAIIPNSPRAGFFANHAAKMNKEVMLHAPMSTIHNIPLGENGLSESMDESDFKETLKSSLDSLPSASGVNNHMGSLLTQRSLPMEWLMQALQERDLYFIDSRTTANSVAWKVAQEFNIPSLKRDIFLDHEATEEFIDGQFQKLTEIAQRRGYAVAIAHPYQETITYLEKHLPKLEQQNIDLVPVSQLLSHHSRYIMAQKSSKKIPKVTKKL